MKRSCWRRSRERDAGSEEGNWWQRKGRAVEGHEEEQSGPSGEMVNVRYSQSHWQVIPNIVQPTYSLQALHHPFQLPRLARIVMGT